MIQTGDPLGDGTGGESIWGGELLNAGGREGGREGRGCQSEGREAGTCVRLWRMHAVANLRGGGQRRGAHTGLSGE